MERPPSFSDEDMPLIGTGRSAPTDTETSDTRELAGILPLVLGWR